MYRTSQPLRSSLVRSAHPGGCAYPAARSLPWLLLGLLLAPGARCADAPLEVGRLVPARLDSPHPYPPGSLRQRVVHPGATYVALHFEHLELAPGDRLVVRSPDGGEAHTYTGRGPARGRSFWALSITGDQAVVELVATARTRAWGYSIDSYAHGIVPSGTDSTCGADDKRDARCYDVSHPVHYSRSRAVGRLLWCGRYLCTGALISPDSHFLTADHCSGSICGEPPEPSNAEVWFDYEARKCDRKPLAKVKKYRGSVHVAVNDPLDYWVFQLEGDPASEFGHLTLDPRPLVRDEVIYVPQHPRGKPKVLGIESDTNAGGVCRVDETNRSRRSRDTDAGYHCDTDHGSSGAPVLAESSHAVVALHKRGGCPNSGVRMQEIARLLGPELPCAAFDLNLDAPAELDAPGVAPERIRLWWSAVEGATAYRVLRAAGGCDEPFEPLVELEDTSHVDAALEGGRVYGYEVEAVGPFRCRGARSSCVSARAPVGVAPGEVSPSWARRRFTLVKQPGGRIEAHFAPCSEVTGYNLYQGQLSRFYSHGEVPFLCDLSTTSLAPDHLTVCFVPDQGDRYYYVTAWTGHPLHGLEGSAGTGSRGPRPDSHSTCPPSDE